MKEKRIEIGRCIWEQDVHGFYITPMFGVSKVKGLWSVWIGWLYWLFIMRIKEKTA